MRVYVYVLDAVVAGGMHQPSPFIPPPRPAKPRQKKRVARMGIEPTTFCLLDKRSNQLSYPAEAAGWFPARFLLSLTSRRRGAFQVRGGQILLLLPSNAPVAGNANAPLRKRPPYVSYQGRHGSTLIIIMLPGLHVSHSTRYDGTMVL